MAYLPLSTANLPNPAIDPAQGSSPEDYFNTVLYDGSASAQSITGVGFQPDFVWIKKRSGANSHNLVDVVRGADKRLFSNATSAEFDNTGFSFDSDGFTVTTSGSQNESGFTFVGWNWKANGSGVSNTDGSITSTVSANTASGFSIITYTGNGTSGSTIGHGLDQAPEMTIIRRRDGAESWVVWHTSFGSAQSEIRLEQTNPINTSAPAMFNNTYPTSSLITLGNGGFTNTNTWTYVCYAFHSVDGFSKFGSYTGNGSADGPFVYTGFRPAWVMFKRSDSAGSWFIADNKRNVVNPLSNYLFADLSDAENTSTDRADFLSNGFKVLTSNGNQNANGGTYIYMAFAEMPTKFSLAR